MKRIIICLISLLLVFSLTVNLDGKAKKGDQEKKKEANIFGGLKFRSIGPAYCSGRIADFAVNPNDHSEYYVGVASGNIWKTQNAGITWTPVFDKYGAYSIGSLAMDPTNHHVVWAGTGENNHQRALGYGDGVYKTVDGGKSWKNMGLKNSRHIGMIAINPQNPDLVYVAAEGSAWGPGGERGLYKTIDGGKTWKKVLDISQHTGVNNVILDPRDPNLIYATSEQRRRHVFTKIGGGPETAIYKSTDAGDTWRKLKSGLPSSHMGGIGLALSPADPDVIYAIIEAAEDKGGFFRSSNRGETWKKMSSHASSGQYYNEIYCDPKDVNKVFSVETLTYVTLDGGKTWRRLSNKDRHVDDHAMWIDPNNSRHYLIGGDGGMYETYDDGAIWRFMSNLPVTQFYRVSVDNDLPFYNVFGGTQDNNSMGGPSRTINRDGIVSDDWFVTNGGDGFWTFADPKNPNIVYAESQYGNIVRYDRKSGESLYIRPQPRKGEKTYRWNWNTPMIISPHANTRLYCAANKVFRSDDRGHSWKVISEDLTAQIDRNKWPVMGKYWSAEAVVKDVSTSQYGTIVSMDESPIKEDLLYIGTDDGLIQISENAGDPWRRIATFPGVPEYTYVSDVFASRHDENVVFASFDNRKRDDFKPYLLKSRDKGRTWRSIAANLPKSGTVHTIAEDHVKAGLLFAGTEFGVFFSPDGGTKWHQLKAGLPTISVRDLAIQERENDLVLATFGRGFYVLDDYSSLRQVTPEVQNKEAHIFPVREALMYIPVRGRYGQGATYYRAKNPDYGATFTYYVKDSYITKRDKRRKEEKKLFEAGQRIRVLSWEEMREEGKEEAPHLIFTIRNGEGHVVRQLRTKAGKGIQRLTWDLAYPSPYPVELKKDTFNPLEKGDSGVPALPGKYTVTMAKSIDGVVTDMTGPVEFNTRVLENTTLPAPDRKALAAFQKKLGELTRIFQGILKTMDETNLKLAYFKQSLVTIAAPSQKTGDLSRRVRAVESRLDKIIFAIRGHRPKASSEEIPPTHPPLLSRLRSMIWAHYRSTSAITQIQKDTYRIIVDELRPLHQNLERIVKQDIPSLEKELDAVKAPWTPGRFPKWMEE